MKAEELALDRAPPTRSDTRRTLERWNRDPFAVLWPWVRGSLAVTALLLAAIWLVANLSTPDPTGAGVPGVAFPARTSDFAFVLYRNGLVLALHALACVAGFMAGSALPTVATGYTGLWRRIHDRAGPLAIGFVVAATLFSLCTQAYALGHRAADLAGELGMSPALLLVGLLPHAVPELTALFLPLAAWTLASRRDAWEELLAATFVTVAVAAPVLLGAAAVETWVSPHLVAILSEATAP
ncbi:MAG TPA: stage II sporulation protein M [Solirubrobacteraceae bacterium]|nr:stage II sporulation protein M [Solirubrobacteraceae bacterium]